MRPASPGPRRRVRRRLLAVLAVPAVALAGALSWPDGGATRAAAAGITDAAATTSADASSAATAGVDALTATPAVDSAAVLAAVDAAAATAGGSIAVVVLDAGGTTVVASTDAADGTYTASLVKLLVVQQLLERDAAGTIALDGDDLALMQRAVEASDDDAMSTLWTRWDGAGLVTAAAAEFGLTGTAAPQTAGQWGQATTTAADYATFLGALAAHLSTADLATLTSWMQATTATAADGFDQRFGLVAADLATDGAVAAKQGWMCCVAATRQLHSAGVLPDGRVVVLLGDFPSSTGWAAAATALDAAAAAVVSGT